MFLSIDVGNTQTTLGLFSENGTLDRQWRMATDHTDTADELHERLYGYFQMFGLDIGQLEHASVASVVPILTEGWRRILRILLDEEPLVIDAARDCGIEVIAPNKHGVGADRVANALAAKITYGAPAIVVDFGTATNIDVVNAQGAYCGGAISPGLLLSAQALFARAAKLSSVEIVAPARALGTDTETALQSGLVIGAAGQAEGLVRRIKAELGIEGAPVIGTGGYAPVVAEATDLFDHLDPDLTIRGIREIWYHRAVKRAARHGA
ncbi:MAG: type III pantothenate kinase [Atopobiaceae bacterium]|jgi:type III pantothenate kinase|nr:type III pantothenate kinase [Atopobiaceae bacterium]